MDPSSCILYIVFLLCSGYCAGAETAFTAVSKVRLRTMADKGNKRARKALWVSDRKRSMCAVRRSFHRILKEAKACDRMNQTGNKN